MTTLLFWNIGGRDIADEVAAAARENDVDVLILAESQLNSVEMLPRLNAHASRIYIAPFNPSSALTFFVRFGLESFEPILDEGGISLRRVRPPIGRELLLAALHLPSKLHRTEHEQTIFSVRISQLIRDAETKLGHQNTLIIGDLNMSPFEAGVVAAEGIHGVMDKKIALRMNRKVDKKSFPFFYNPMWNRLGDETTGPPGTYYYGGGSVSHFWHTFDQVLLRPSMLDVFSSSSLKVLTEVNGRALIRNNKIDGRISDHLPISITLNLEKDI